MRNLILTICILSIIGCKKHLNSNSSWELVQIPCPSLSNSLIEKDTTKTIGIYLPPTYTSNPKKNYPVVYFLQGYGQGIYDKGYTCWILDSLIHRQQVPEMIFVDISGRYTFGGSFYVNSSVSGNWEDFVVLDVINYIDNNYRSIPNAKSRALTGHSMGGYGALNITMKHPDIFKVAYSMSPGLFDQQGLENSQMFKNGGTIHPTLQLLNELSSLNNSNTHQKFMEYIKSIEDWNVEFTLAYGIAFAPNTQKAPYFEYPLSIEGTDTIIDPKIWNNWESGFGGIDKELTQYQNKLKELSFMAIDCGYLDDFKWIMEGTLYYSHELEKKKIPHQINWHSGTHGSHFKQSVQHGLFPTSATYLQFEE